MTRTHQDHHGSGLEHKQVHEGNKSSQVGAVPALEYNKVKELCGPRIRKMIQDLEKRKGRTMIENFNHYHLTKF